MMTNEAAVGEIRNARATLSVIGQSEDGEITSLIDEYGVVEAAAMVQCQRIPDGSGVVDVARTFAEAEKIGARLVTPEDDEWPTVSLEALPMYARPIALWVRGDANLVELTAGAVAVVGSRVPSTYGVSVAQEMAWKLADLDRTILSASAYGIDETAIRAAIRQKCAPVMVSASGAGRVYPSALARLHDEVLAAGGLIVSASAPGAEPSRARFTESRRLVGALPVGVVVVEAGPRSGSLNIAEWAHRVGTRVCAVPGCVGSAMSVGCHRLIQEGATLVTSADEVNEALS